MWYRTFAVLLVICSVQSVPARSEELHEKWMKYFTGKWNWKTNDGNHGMVVFEPFSNACGQVVKERSEKMDMSTVMTQGWRPDIKAFGGAGFDSEGNYVETYFTELTETGMKGQRIRRSADKESKELWEVTRKSQERYDITFTIDGEVTTAVITRQ